MTPAIDLSGLHGCAWRHYARSARAARPDQLLLIGIAWNLDCDRLDQQSDACLRRVAAILR